MITHQCDEVTLFCGNFPEFNFLKETGGRRNVELNEGNICVASSFINFNLTTVGIFVGESRNLNRNKIGVSFRFPVFRVTVESVSIIVI